MLTQVIAQDHRANLAAQDHRVYDQRQTEIEDKINGGPECCGDREEISQAEASSTRVVFSLQES